MNKKQRCFRKAFSVLRGIMNGDGSSTSSNNNITIGNSNEDTIGTGFINWSQHLSKTAADEIAPVTSIPNNIVNNISTTNNYTLPDHLNFNQNSLIVVVVYSVFFVIAAYGNLTVLFSLRNVRKSNSRINLMIVHLALADLFVTFIIIPLEIFWRITVEWVAGNAACKIFLLFRAFGLYLSSNVIVCISLDRYFAILYPLKVANAKKRGKIMLRSAWIISFAWALPQSIVFHVASHPDYPDFKQCVSFGFFRTDGQEIAYNLFCVCGMYFAPLLVILFVYTAIMWKIFQKSRKPNNKKSKSKVQLRRSEYSNIERARSRTLRLAITIVVVFLWCWTPYVFMTLWYMFDRNSAENVPNWLQESFFMMAVSNSCMNPIVYGSYVKGLCQKLRKILSFFSCWRQKKRDRFDSIRMKTSESNFGDHSSNFATACNENDNMTTNFTSDVTCKQAIALIGVLATLNFVALLEEQSLKHTRQADVVANTTNLTKHKKLLLDMQTNKEKPVSSKNGSITAITTEDQFLSRALSDTKYLRRQIKCLLNESGCDTIGRRLKSMLPIILRGGCPKVPGYDCSAKDVAQIKQAVLQVQAKYPREFNRLIQQYIG